MGLQKIVLLVLFVGVALFLLGKAINCVLFTLVFVYLVIKAEETNSLRYYGGLLVAVVTVITQVQYQQGLEVFNSIVGTAVVTSFLGLVDA